MVEVELLQIHSSRPNGLTDLGKVGEYDAYTTNMPYVCILLNPFDEKYYGFGFTLDTGDDNKAAEEAILAAFETIRAK